MHGINLLYNLPPAHLGVGLRAVPSDFSVSPFQRYGSLPASCKRVFDLVSGLERFIRGPWVHDRPMRSLYYEYARYAVQYEMTG